MHIRELEKVLLYVRIKWLVIAMTLVVIFWEDHLHVIGPVTALFSYTGLAMVSLTNFVLEVNSRRKTINRFLVYFSLFFDLFFICLLLYLNGGAENTWWFLPSFIIITAGYLVHTRAAIIVAFLSAGSVVLLFTLEYLHIIPHFCLYQFHTHSWQNPVYTATSCIGMIILYFFVAVLSSFANSISNRFSARIEQSLKALKESEEKYRSLLKTSPDAVTVTDLQGKIIEVSDRTMVLHGAKSPDQLIGLSAFKLIAPEDHARAQANLQKTLQHNFISPVEYTLLRLDGSRVAGELSASLIRDAEGKPKAFIASVRDVSERKKNEDQLEKTFKETREFNDLAIGRELRMIELEKEVDQLLHQLGQPPKYNKT